MDEMADGEQRPEMLSLRYAMLGEPVNSVCTRELSVTVITCMRSSQQAQPTSGRQQQRLDKIGCGGLLTEAQRRGHGVGRGTGQGCLPAGERGKSRRFLGLGGGEAGVNVTKMHCLNV